jgi:hypothetical protein
MSSLPSAQSASRDRWTQLATAGAQADSLRILNMPAWPYHAELERQSCSMLKPLLLSPAHYKAQFFQRRASSPAMSVDTLVHTLVLEPICCTNSTWSFLKGSGHPPRIAASWRHPIRERS